MLAADHVGQQAAVVDQDLGLLQGRHHSSVHGRVAETTRGGGGAGGFRRREHEVDTIAGDTEAEQSLHRGVDVDVVAVDDGVTWSTEREREMTGILLSW